jgi:hypothetical protein
VGSVGFQFPIVAGTGSTASAPVVWILPATTTADGSMVAADKVKLNGIATGATANTGTVTGVTGSGGVVVSPATPNPNVSLTYGSTASTVCQGNDARLAAASAGNRGTVYGFTNLTIGADGALSLSGTNVANALGFTPVSTSGTVSVSNSCTGNAASATYTPSLRGAGATIYGATGIAYTSAVQVREANLGGAQASDPAVAPRLGFHWGGVVASSIRMDAGGHFHFDDNPGTNLTPVYVYATDFTAQSDRRLKQNIGAIPDALARVIALAGARFSFRDDATGKMRLGLIAQDVQGVFPEAVHADEAGMLSVSYGSLVGALVEAIKAQQAQIDALRTRPSIWRRFMRWLRRR